MEEDAALLGLTLPSNEAPKEIHFEVLKENWPVLEAFLVLNDCAWQFTGMGELIGLDYAAAHIIWGYSGIKPTQEVFAGVMLFSKTVVYELNKRKKS